MASPRIGIDTGGTFTDIAVIRGRRLEVHKVPSTPDDPGRAVLAGLADVRRANEEVDIVHGTTVALNAVLEDRLPRTAFVTNEGFADLIEIGRQERSHIYDLDPQKPLLPVHRRLRFAVNSRRAADGKRLGRPTATELRALRQKLQKARVECIAIGLLHSYKHPGDEREVARALRPLAVPVTCSAELLPVHGEYERFAAAILNAAIRPIMSRYVAQLVAAIKPGQLRLMRSSGGIMTAAEATTFPARAAFSGPAGGVAATRALADQLGFRDTAMLDMGGTSTDVCLVRPHGAPAAEGISKLRGLPLALPAEDVHTIGCGGGSIAWVDSGGALRVGPQSAGADPGPACYGKGSEPTVTDAHMVLGHMGGDTLLGGDFPTDPARSLGAIEVLARKLGLSPRATAVGILEVAEVNMMRALLTITVERAVDPMGVGLVAFGGAGGLHAAGLARRLDMPAAVVPAHPGAFSAVGLGLAGESQEVIVPVLRQLEDLSAQQLDELAELCATRALRALGDGDAGRGGAPRVQLEARLRFEGQGPTLPTPFKRPLHNTFRTLHQQRFGFVPADRTIELVELRARAERDGPRLRKDAAAVSRRRPRPVCERRPPGGGPPWPVYHRGNLLPGQVLLGPCLVEEPTAVTVVPPATRCKVRCDGLFLTRS
ncbi:MAG: hydantoinase/oxoprolinase family protein [Planctomycetota bacterium]|jgi:N-methylhydantoinase A/oxoprolinase/acetone carboxylase beta subunit